MQGEVRWWLLIGVVAGCFDPQAPPSRPPAPTPTPTAVCETVTPLNGFATTTDAVLPQILAPMSCYHDAQQVQQVAYRFDVTGGPKGLVISIASDDAFDIRELALQRTCGDVTSELGCEQALHGE